jgi:hypothetical protein
MENITLFIFGFCIFFLYMFFLLRMIWKQNKIQTRENQITDEST